MLNLSQTARFSRFSLFLLIYALIIILWGAWVRISGSGDGCGPHWPLCHGKILIDADFTAQAKTFIEYLHRLKSGLFGLLVVALYFYSLKVFPKSHAGRSAALGALVLTITEALLGAKLVLLGLVGDDDSLRRALSMSLHLLNTLLLLYFLTACWQVRNNTVSIKPKPFVLKILVLLLVIAASGGVAALASTLFPSADLLSGIKADFDSNSHWLIRLRIFHPVLAILLGSWILVILQRQKENTLHLVSNAEESQCAPGRVAIAEINLAQRLICLVLTVGLVTLITASPNSLKLIHLLLADLAWIFCVKLSYRPSP